MQSLAVRACRVPLSVQPISRVFLERRMAEYLRWFETLGMHDVDLVGGKNASLGEMISHLLPLGVQVPGGFATTAQAYRDFLGKDDLAGRIKAELDALDVDDVAALARTGAA